MPSQGIFITLEGDDGVGKSTLARALATALEGEGLPYLLTSEPGATTLGRELRRLLLGGPLELSPWAELFLFAADRAQHVREVILPALNEGKVVLCERFTDSTIAYQGYGRGLDLEAVRQVCLLASGGLAPHLTLLLDMEPQEALARKPQFDCIGGEDLEFHRRVRKGFLALASQDPQRVVVIEASRPQGEVAAVAWGYVRRLLDTLSG